MKTLAISADAVIQVPAPISAGRTDNELLEQHRNLTFASHRADVGGFRLVSESAS
jgi:hypothetical protein